MNRKHLTAAALAALLSFTLTGCMKSSNGGGGGGAPTGGGISKGLGAHDASRDVKLGRITQDPTLGLIEATVIITNHSSQRSDYFVDLALQSATGARQYDTTTVFVQNLEPGQSSTQKGEFLAADRVPGSARVVVKSVQRTASY